MTRHTLTRRQAMIATLAAGASGLLFTPSRAALPAPYTPDQTMIDAATKEGVVVWYTSTDVAVAEKMASAFEAKYPGIKAQVERSGAERIFQRISQEYASNIHAVDVIETSDAVNFVAFKRNGWLAQAVPADVAQWPANVKDPDGCFAAYRAHLSVMGYNTHLVKPEDAPKSHTDLLDPKWSGKIVKGHPGYSGTIMTDTFALSQALGWDYFEKLGKQRVMQVQSSTEPPKKLSLGERAIMADGNEYNMFLQREKGDPVDIIYPTDGATIAVGHAALLAKPAHPNAGRLFYYFLFTGQAQQLMSDVGGLRSFHPGVKLKPGRKPLSEIKVLYSDANALEPQIEAIKKRYTQYFGV